MSFLAVDVGNTRLKWALYSMPKPGAVPLAHGAVFLEAIDSLAEGPWRDLPMPSSMLGSVVAGEGIRRRTEAQLDAFAADDAKKAFSYAAPSIREMFGTPERFVEMVRAGYPAVYRPASVTFLQPLWVQGQMVQGVRLTDADGGQWLATYRLERQADKSWRISGCDVQPATGRMT